MNIESIKGITKEIPSKAKAAVETVGKFSIEKAKAAKSAITNSTKLNAVKADTVEFVTKKTDSLKEAVKSSNILNFLKSNKDALVGGAAILAGVAALISIIKAVVNANKQ